MQDFNLYFRLGIDHILTWEALDHILFVTALCLRYLLKYWKKVIILVTAFTIGHSITLALAGLGYVHFSKTWIEFLIPLTILATAINNIFQKPADIQSPSKLPLIYFLALFFVLIHGLVYARTFRLKGADGLLAHLFAFNAGIEIAQLLVVTVVLIASFVFVQLLRVSRLWWIRIISLVILMASIKMAFERLPS